MGRLKMKKKRRRLMKKPKTQSPKMMKMTKNSTTKMKTTKKMQMKLTTNCKWMKKKRMGFNETNDTVNRQHIKIEAYSFYNTLINNFLSDDAFKYVCFNYLCVRVSVNRNIKNGRFLKELLKFENVTYVKLYVSSLCCV